MNVSFDAATVAREAVERADERRRNPDPEFGIDIPPEFADDALALRFSDRHAARLRYVAAWSRWLIREPSRWRPDDTLHVFDLVRSACRHSAAECDKDNVAKAIASAKTVAAVERLARSDRRHAARPEDFDADPWELNTPRSVIDLRIGEIRPHRETDTFTKVTSVAPGGDCPLWHRFLDETCAGDQALAEYLQRWAGYTLTGLIREHAFAFLHGPGGNGKSVLLGVLAGILGEYATTAMSDVFTVGRNDQHPTHLASLRGARMVTVTETEEGRPWAESRIKSLTGGDMISARVMRGNPFEFSPIFKLWIAGNHRPTLRNPDPAMRRRLHLVPLTHVPDNPDPELPEKLRAEWPGILAWAIDGCIGWQERGLTPPPIVADATSAYFADQDSLSEWVAERCERQRGAAMPARAAFADWKAWMIQRGEEPGTEKRFSAELERMFAKQRAKTGVQFLGTKLRPTDMGAW